ncbi:MAG: ATP-binding protein [Candidatus Dormibacteraceae bacterium]
MEEAKDAQQLGRVVRRYAGIELLILDELGYVQTSESGAELLFQVLAERNEVASITVTTNLPFGEWTRVFADTRLCKAVVEGTASPSAPTSSRPAPTPGGCAAAWSAPASPRNRLNDASCCVASGNRGPSAPQSPRAVGRDRCYLFRLGLPRPPPPKGGPPANQTSHL